MINSYAHDEISILAWNGSDSWGEPLSGTIVTIKGYVEWADKLIRDIKGEEVYCSVKVYIPMKVERAAYLGRALRHDDRIWIEGESHERTIIRIDKPKAFNLPHYEVYLT